MHKRLTISMTVLIVATFACAMAYQEDHRATLPELARRFSPSPVHQARIQELILLPIEEVLPKAEVIVHGKVTRLNTYLSADQRDLYTDFTIVPIRMIRPVQSMTVVKPGAPPASKDIVVKRWGGTMTIDGVQVTQESSDTRWFNVGDEVLLLLAYSKTDGKYTLPSAASGAFLITPAGLGPIAKNLEDQPVFDRVRGKSVAEFETLIHRQNR